MPIGILNNIASLAAENQLTITNNSLQSVLYQLSSGSRINTGADDAAGLAIANGLQANVTALTQSARNANDGVGSLQVADGSLAQVTTLLNRAVTLATESATGTVSNTQRVALDAEFTQIKNEINRIGSTTNYNGSQVFTTNALSIFLSDSTSTGASSINVTTGALSTAGLGLAATATATLGAVGNATAGDTVTVGGQTYTFAAAAGAANTVAIGATAAATMANLVAAINGGAGAGVAYGTGTGANGSATAVLNADGSATLTATVSGVAGNSVASTTTGTGKIAFSTGTTFTGGGANGDLLTAADAQGALSTINTAIANVAALRGTIGAAINRLQSASNVISNQTQNLTSAMNGIQAADIPTAVANLTKYSILEQTGISSLAQANQQQQLVLKLLQ